MNISEYGSRVDGKLPQQRYQPTLILSYYLNRIWREAFQVPFAFFLN